MPVEKKETHLLRSVLIFPEFDDSNVLDAVRKKYDPAYTTIRPHLTLIFPFYSAYTAEEIFQKTHSGLHGFKSFKIALHELQIIKSYICMIPDKDGYDLVKKMAQQLYAEQFEEFIPDFLRQEDFIPHMTIGKCTPGTAELYKNDIQEKIGTRTYETTISKISIEIIAAENKSIIESEISFL